MFDTRRLQCLQAVHVHGSVLDAALELGLTSSAVSQQISKLEKEVGTRLLERAGRGVVLTDAARILVEAADEISAVTDRATARLEDLRHDLSGTLRVSSFPSVIGPFVAPALATMKADAPDLTVHLHRVPAGEWVCLDSLTVPERHGVGMTDTLLLDERGPIGRAAQSLLVAER